MVARIIIISSIAFSALLIGALFALPAVPHGFVRVDVNGTPLLAEVASNPEARARGLGGRRSIAEYGAMLFTFDQPGSYGIWMKDMRFPIDIFWIRNGVVADMQENAPSFPSGTADALLPVYRPDVPADYVLETHAGLAEKYHIIIGDSVVIHTSNSAVLRSSALNDPSSSQTNDATTPDAGTPYFIETIRANPPEGSDFKTERLLTENNAYQKFLISYRTDGLKISGIMNVPRGTPPPGGFPVLILNHGLIKPDIYFPGRGSKREQDFFPRHGYVVIHPDYRGLGESDPNPYAHHDFYVGYSRDVLGLIDAVKKSGMPIFDTGRMGMWGHSMGGGITARVMTLTHDIRAFVLFAPISADVKDNFYELSKDELGWLDETYGIGTDGDARYAKMSPINYFNDIDAPVQIHHGTGDIAVPIEFSEKMYETLTKDSKRVEFYKYPNEPHEFINGWPLAAGRALQFFDRYVKNAK